MSKVIVKYINGQEKRGNVLSFNFNNPTFHLQVENAEGKVMTSMERMSSVKQIHFLKNVEPRASLLHTETIDKSIFAGTLAYRLMIEFKDGSVLNGTSNKYNPNDKGFYIIPLNPADKSERIFVNVAATKHVESMRLLGKILVEQKKISEAQLAEGLKHQKEIREKKIGSLLKENNFINDHQLNESLQKQKKSPQMLGEILVQAGYITPEQLQYVLKVQHDNKKKKLGQLLVELKFLLPSDICIALATQFRCAWIDLSDVKILKDIATILPEEVVRRLEVIPVEKKENDILAVATSQPQNTDIWLEVRKASPFKVELVVAYEEYILRNIDFFFHRKRDE